MWIIIDGTKASLNCNVLGDITKTFRLNPTNWGSDVLSIQPDGSAQHRDSSFDGSFEQFHMEGDFAVVTPINDKDHTSFSFKTL